ncbi:MAG TPA: MFS transporter, partial [Anaerolineales bacterium]|nr:MFS transporter [Anaerolineales bacterium]
ISALLAVRISKKFGLINTMVFTHIPSSILLMMIQWMPTLWPAVVLLLLRFSISQMDVPTRQSYTMAMVEPDERSAASGVTAIARSLGSAISPALTGLFFSVPALFNLPFFLCGGLKIIYDLLLFREFRTVKPPEENI